MGTGEGFQTSQISSDVTGHPDEPDAGNMKCARTGDISTSRYVQSCTFFQAGIMHARLCFFVLAWCLYTGNQIGTQEKDPASLLQYSNKHTLKWTLKCGQGKQSGPQKFHKGRICCGPVLVGSLVSNKSTGKDFHPHRLGLYITYLLSCLDCRSKYPCLHVSTEASSANTRVWI